jgi:prophage regulatory protein
MTTVPPEAMMQDDDRLLPWRRVKDLTGLSRTTAWRLQKAGDFPVPVLISPGRVGWRQSEVAAWKASRAPRSASPPRPAPQPRTFFVEAEPVAPQVPPPSPPPQPQSRRAPPRRRALSTGPSQMNLNF